jgi:hypothetical protein
MAKAKNQQRQQQMYEFVEQYKKSGQSKEKFCKEKSINLHTFEYWYQKFRKSTEVEKFIEIKPTRQNSIIQNTGQTIKLSYPNGIVAEIPTDTKIEIIQSLINF